MQEIRVDRRFRGPPNSGNGGYVCGILARHVGPNAVVTLRRPIPLDRKLALIRHTDGATLFAGEELLAEARPDVIEIDSPATVSFEAAQAASASVAEHDHRHPLPGCFVCGPERTSGDGLRLRPGPIGDGLLATPWRPDAALCADDGLVAAEYVWSVLDCPSGFAAAWRQPDSAILLGRLAASIRGRPAPGDLCVITAWPTRQDGRKLHAEAALFGKGSTLLAVARATWIIVSREVLAAAGT